MNGKRDLRWFLQCIVVASSIVLVGGYVILAGQGRNIIGRPRIFASSKFARVIEPDSSGATAASSSSAANEAPRILMPGSKAAPIIRSSDKNPPDNGGHDDSVTYGDERVVFTTQPSTHPSTRPATQPATQP